jgi:hypothetical protein
MNSAIAYIMAQILKTSIVDTFKFECANPIPKTPVPTTYEIVGEEYFAPDVVNGFHQGWTLIDSVNLPANAVLTTRLRDRSSGSTIWILGAKLDWATRADACCGTLPEMPEITLPALLDTEEPCGISVCTPANPVYTYQAAFVAPLITGQKLTVVGNNDGVAFTPSAPGAGFASVAAALTWLQANWGAYGTWSAVGTTGIKLESNGVTKGYFDLRLQDVVSCVVIAAAQVIDRVVHNGREYLLNKSITIVDAATLIPQIKDYFADGTLTAFSSTKITYTGKGIPTSLKNGSTVVDSFSVGACS